MGTVAKESTSGEFLNTITKLAVEEALILRAHVSFKRLPKSGAPTKEIIKR